MNIKITASSFALSRWKQSVKTSSSVADSQIESPCFRQNCFVQSLHIRGGRASDEELFGKVKVLSKGIIVEFEKQVHLQKVVGAGYGQMRTYQRFGELTCCESNGKI